MHRSSDSHYPYFLFILHVVITYSLTSSQVTLATVTVKNNIESVIHKHNILLPLDNYNQIRKYSMFQYKDKVGLGQF